MKVFVIAVTSRPQGQIRPIDYPHGEFEANDNELLIDFLNRVGMPTDNMCRVTLPEWGITSDDLSGQLKDYDIRDSDAVYIMYNYNN